MNDPRTWDCLVSHFLAHCEWANEINAAAAPNNDDDLLYMITQAKVPLFALGILIARLLTPLSWIVERTQWS